MLNNIFYEITLIILFSAVIGAIGSKLKQPLIVSFIAVGILMGPSGLGLIMVHEHIDLLAEMGIALLLFIVGLKLDLHTIKTMGPVASATGLGQILFTSVFGFLIAHSLGLPTVHAVYVAVALTFSSTIIIVKLLSDKREIDSLHGRIAVGFLIVQDIIVVLVMIGLSAFGEGAGTGSSVSREIIFVFVKGALFLGGILLLMRYVLPAIFKVLAKTQELLILSAIAWAVFLAALGDALGFSKEVGAFLAGVAVASTPYRESIGTRLVTLRDFLLLFFFINLGARLNLGVLSNQAGNALIFSSFVLVGNPIIVMIIMGVMGYRKRTGFLAGLTVAQISEFSLILAALGMNLGHIDMDTMGLITLVGLITIATSTYMIIYSTQLYKGLSPVLAIFEKKTPHKEQEQCSVKQESSADVILFGLGNYGSNIACNLLHRNKKVIGIDFDPEVLEQWRKSNVPVIYGDVEDPDILENLPINKSRWVVSTFPDRFSNITLLKALKQNNYQGKVVLTARRQEDVEVFRSAGADIVLKPFVDVAEQAADILTSAMHSLSGKMEWNMALKEVHLKPGSVFSGKTIGEIPLRAKTGASILAVSRAGKNHFDPGPKFQLYPGDRVILLGDDVTLKKAKEFLAQREFGGDEDVDADEFKIESIDVKPGSPWVNKTIASLNFRNDYGVTIIGIQRGEKKIAAPAPDETIKVDDRLFIAGNKSDVDSLT
ncbi:MAG: cation:proton antiporter [Candidatus Aminicenantaceae bacterium]